MVDYSQSITKIKHLIDTDTYNTVAYFKLLLGSVTQHSLPSVNWQASGSAAVTQTTEQDRSSTQISITTNKPQTPPTPASTSSTSAPTPRTVASNKSTEVTDSSSKSVSAKTDLQEYKLDELLVALNKLSNFTTQYLGKVVVTNYWKSSRPTSSWLAEFEIDRSGQISHPKQTAISLDTEQLQQIQSWVAAYIKRCKLVIRNFDQMLGQDCLDSRQKQILF